MSTAQIHLATWEAAGLIDHETADRLRAGSLDEAATEGPSTATVIVREVATTRPIGAAGSWFGPGVTIAEVFAYLGVGFLVGAYNAALAKAASGVDSTMILAVGWIIGAVILIVIGAAIRTIDARSSRGAGVLLLAGLGFAATGFTAFAQAQAVDWTTSTVIVGVSASLVGLGLRRLHPAVLTQVSLLWAMTATAAAGIVWVEATYFPSTDIGVGPTTNGPDPLLLVLGSAAWWLVVAVALALIGLREGRAARRTDDATAGRRAAVSRFWAGFVAVVGLTSAVTMSRYEPLTYEYVRTLAPWIGDLGLLILAVVLIERAFRRDATSFIYAAALGLIIALTDFNVSYLSNSTEGALLIEGLILLGVGFAADRLRRQVGGGTAGAPQAPLPTEPTGPPEAIAPHAPTA
jgi:hypothetical protein